MSRTVLDTLDECINDIENMNEEEYEELQKGIENLGTEYNILPNSDFIVMTPKEYDEIYGQNNKLKQYIVELKGKVIIFADDELEAKREIESQYEYLFDGMIIENIKEK